MAYSSYCIQSQSSCLVNIVVAKRLNFVKLKFAKLMWGILGKGYLKDIPNYFNMSRNATDLDLANFSTFLFLQRDAA